MQKATIKRLRSKFIAAPYAEQLDQFTAIRQQLRRVLGSDEAAAATVSTMFKPHLKKPGSASLKPARRRTPGGTGATDEIPDMILDLVERRPRQLSRKQCVKLLSGDPYCSLRKDRCYGKGASAGAGSIRASIQSLIDRGSLAQRPDGMLDLAREARHR